MCWPACWLRRRTFTFGGRASGAEVDFVVEHGRRLLGIEVKQTGHPGYGDCTGLVQFLAEHPLAAGGLLLHGGQEIRRLGEKIVALPWTMLTG